MSKMDYIARILKENGYKGKLTGFSECRNCGMCCKRNSCACSPEDLGEISVFNVERILNTKKYMITASYEKNVEENDLQVEIVPVISAREINTPKTGINLSMLRSQCALLTRYGCKLSFNERPSQGLLLIPRNGECHCYMENLVDIWRPYKKVLNQVIKLRTGKNADELFKEDIYLLANYLKKKILKFGYYSGIELTTNEYMVAFEMDCLGIFSRLYGEYIGIIINELINEIPIQYIS